MEEGLGPMIAGIPIAGLTAPALLGIAVLMLLLGRIIPRSTYQDKCDEAERWRLAYETEREARALADAQVRDLMEVAKTSQGLISGVYANSERIRQSGEPNVPKT